jgi:hypothetical protein
MNKAIQKCINDFKDGVVDGLLNGNAKEGSREHYYKQGYDFGITLYYRLEIDYEDDDIDEISDALSDAYDIQKSFDFKKIADKPKDNEGTSITLKDCIDNIVEILGALKGKEYEDE